MYQLLPFMFLDEKAEAWASYAIQQGLRIHRWSYLFTGFAPSKSFATLLISLYDPPIILYFLNHKVQSKIPSTPYLSSIIHQLCARLHQ